MEAVFRDKNGTFVLVGPGSFAFQVVTKYPTFVTDERSFLRGIKFKVASCRWNCGLEHCAPSGHGVPTTHIDACSLSSLHDYAMLFVECSDSLRLFQGFSFNKKLIFNKKFQSSEPFVNSLGSHSMVLVYTTNLLCSFLSLDDFFEAVQHHIRKMSSLVIPFSVCTRK